MHIVIDARILRSSTGRYTDNLLHYLQEIDIKNHYTVLLREKDFSSWEPTNRNFTKLVADFDNFKPKDQVLFNAFLNALNFDLIHFTFQAMPPMFNGKFIITIHDLTQLRFKNLKNKNALLYELKLLLLRYNFKRASKKALQIITDTDYVKNDIATSFNVPTNKITTTHLSADKDLGKINNTGSPIEALIQKDFILYVGTAFAHKNLDSLVDAFSLLQLNMPRLHLVLAGKHDQVYEELIERTKAKNIKNIHMLGFVSDEELVWLYRHAQAYVFPSLSEGFGLPPLEAMQFGCPVVCSNATCLPEVNGDAAHYFDPTTIDDMAQKIREVLDDKKLRTELIEKGHEQVKKYSWKRMAEQTLEVYEKALQKSKQ